MTSRCPSWHPPLGGSSLRGDLNPASAPGGEVVAQVGQAGRAQAAAAGLGLHVLEGLALVAHAARDLVERQPGALAARHRAPAAHRLGLRPTATLLLPSRGHDNETRFQNQARPESPSRDQKPGWPRDDEPLPGSPSPMAAGAARMAACPKRSTSPAPAARRCSRWTPRRGRSSGPTRRRPRQELRRPGEPRRGAAKRPRREVRPLGAADEARRARSSTRSSRRPAGGPRPDPTAKPPHPFDNE